MGSFARNAGGEAAPPIHREYYSCDGKVSFNPLLIGEAAPPTYFSKLTEWQENSFNPLLIGEAAPPQ
jgi:hypothetical protein